LSRIIVKPLSNITQKAGSLASGNYGETFHAKGYREVEVLADTLNYAAREIGTTDRLQKELIANISHDLRTPLTLIKGYSEVMRDFPEEITTENMQVLIDETTHLSDLVNDLLDLSRIQTGARVLKSERFDITASIREVCSRYDALLKHRGFTIGFQSDSPVCVCADHSMILQVLYNLINNAVNFSGSDQRVILSQVRVGTRVRISVTDTGDGIKPEDLPLIWDRYYKVDKIHKRAMIGTGLGLSIVKSILEKHSFEYGVESVEGAGSVFYVYFSR
jgi:signal transduction histidine kinase